MTERLADINARIEAARQLSVAVAALRAAAAARATAARGRMDGLHAYAATLARAIGAARAHAGGPPETEARRASKSGPPVVILLGAEQGFAGAFNQRLLQAAAPLLSPAGGQLLMLGSRAAMEARERGLAPEWSAALPARVDHAAATASLLFDALAARLSRPGCEALLVHAAPSASGAIDIRTSRILPVDLSAFSPARGAVPPLLSAAPEELLPQLAEEYMFARLCEAIVLSLGAENEARLRAMAAAQTHIDDMVEDLAGRARRLRQEEITGEIIDLSATALR